MSRRYLSANKLLVVCLFVVFLRMDDLPELFAIKLEIDENISTLDEKLHTMNNSIDAMYARWSLLPSNPGKERCGKYMRSGICLTGAKCQFDHPISENITPEIEHDNILFLTYVTERFVRILKTFSYEAAVDVLGALCGVVTILESEYDFALRYHSYGHICYLYGDLVMRLFVAIENFCSTNLSQPRKTPKHNRKKPLQVDENIPVFVECSLRLQGINKKWLDWEDMVRTDTLSLLYQESECEDGNHKSDGCIDEVITVLSESILTHAAKSLQSQQDLSTAHTAIQSALLNTFRKAWPNDADLKLCTFGSHATELGDGESDLDMTILRSGTINPVDDLEVAAGAAETIGFEIINFVRATRVPVLKLLDKQSGIEVDIVMNNRLALRNSKLLMDYSKVDERVQPLVLAVKKWAKQRGCRDPQNATLTSYAWTLMVIHYLMCHPTDPAPSLRELSHKLREKRCSPSSHRPYNSENSVSMFSLGTLLIEFFAFYGTSSPNGFQPFHAILSLRNETIIFKPTSHLHVPGGSLISAEEALQMTTRDSATDQQDDPEPQVRKTTSTNELTSLITDEAAKKYSDVVALSSPPTWRFCIEDPFEEHDLGRVIYCLTGQIHIMNELKRALTLFYDVVVKYRLLSQQDDASISLEDVCDYWGKLCEENNNIPIAKKTCTICGQIGHFSKDCDLNRCHLCSEKGHGMKDCIMLFCSNCSQQGHFAKDCKKERICRFCKEIGHAIKNCPRRICSKCGSHKHKTKYCLASQADAKVIPSSESGIAEHKANVVSALHSSKSKRHTKKLKKSASGRGRVESSESIDTPPITAMPGRQVNPGGNDQRPNRPEVIQNLPFLRLQVQREDSLSSIGSSPVGGEKNKPPKRKSKQPKAGNGVGLSVRLANAIQSKPSAIMIEPGLEADMKLGANLESCLPTSVPTASSKSPRKSSPTGLKYASSKAVNFDFDAPDDIALSAQSIAESKISTSYPIAIDNDRPFETVLDMPIRHSPLLQAKKQSKLSALTQESSQIAIVRTRSFGDKKNPIEDTSTSAEHVSSTPQPISDDKYIQPDHDTSDMYLSDEKTTSLPAGLRSPLGSQSTKASKRAGTRKIKRPTSNRDSPIIADMKGSPDLSAAVVRGKSGMKRRGLDSKYGRDKKASGSHVGSITEADSAGDASRNHEELQSPVNGFFL